jgi:hypothetical protein
MEKLEAIMTVRGKNFAERCEVIMKQTKSGTGCFMMVKCDSMGEFYVDIRYEHITDIIRLAKMWAKGFWGEKAREITVEC